MIPTASDQRFEGLLESAPDGIVIVDARGTIEIVNGQAESLSGYRRSELIGEPVEVLREFGEDARGEFMNGVRRKIDRTVTVSQVADFSWKTPGAILFELAQILRQLFGAFGSSKGPGS